MRGRIRIALVAAVIGAATASALLTLPAGSSTGGVGNLVLARQLDYELGKATAPKYVQHVSSGVMYEVLQAAGVLDKRADAVGGNGPAIPSSTGTQGCKNVFTATGITTNYRVNQDCSLRRQAEEAIAANPVVPTDVIAGQNDSRIGFNHCGYDWSLDGAITWGDQIPPFYQFLQNDGHEADACSDPTIAFDSKGNAYAGGVIFDINFPASSVVVMKSNASIKGQFWHSPLVQPFQTYRDTPVGLIATNNTANVFNDKELMTADASTISPKTDNVYMTWTRFNEATGAGVGVNSPIYFSQSSDGGATWSRGIEISGANAAICTAFSGEASAAACDQDQGSHPIVGADGTIYVAFGNGNTPTAGINQHLMVKCLGTKDCTKRANWTAPVKISDDIGTQPVGPNATSGCPAGRQCLPPNGYRLDDFVEGSISIDASGNLYFVWADFRNGGAPCNTGDASTSTPPCDNDVFYSFSTNGGATWSAARNITPASQFGATAQWQPWSTYYAGAKRLAVGYYDRSYGSCESSGCNDITLALIANPTSATPTMTYRRITTSSMPNLVPANNPLEAGFLGDYMWVAAGGGRLHIMWADTRGLNQSVEEDVYTAHIGTP